MAYVAKLPDDAQFPQLRIITDTNAVKEVFQHQLPGFVEGRFRIDDLVLNDFRYAPGEKCRVSYKLQVKDTVTGEEGHQDLFGVIEPNSDIEAKYIKARRETHAQPRFGPAVFWLPDLKMILWGFPNDPKLKQLPQLLNEGALTELLRQHWPAFGFPAAVQLANVATDVVKHVPQDRCTLRHTLHCTGAEDLVIYSKTFAPKVNGALIYNVIRTLWEAPVCRSGEIVIPAPLFFEAGMNTMFLRGLHGSNADDNPAALDLDRLAAESGVALAGIHHCPIAGLASRSDQFALSQVAESEEVLVNFDVAYKPRLQALINIMQEKYPGLTPIPPAPMHGAFRLSQMLLVGDKLALIDFDDFWLGNPISDVASFVAHLLYLPLKDKLTPERSRSAIRHFCRAYAGRASWGLPTDVLAWQTAAQLVGKQAKKCIKLAKKNYRNTVDHLLSLAADILAGKVELM